MIETHFTPAGVLVQTPLHTFWLSTQEMDELVRLIKEREQEEQQKVEERIWTGKT